VQNHENTYNKAGLDTATEFSWDNSAIKIMKVLDV